MLLSLESLIHYKNESVIKRFEREAPRSKHPPEEVFEELMKYIWLCHKHQFDRLAYPHDKELEFDCVIHSEMQDIDTMWHTFLLFTKDYLSFCNEYLGGQFFHHEPLSGDVTINISAYEQSLNRYLSYIYDNLGEETIIKWFTL